MNKEELTKCAEAKSDQIDADNLIGGITMDVTIKAVQRGPSNEQPLQLVLDETEKFYRPNKTFRRVLIGCFGDEPANWIGQRLRLARDPNVMWAGVKVGGVVITHASIAAPMVFMLQAKRGKKTAVSIDVIPAIQKPAPMPPKVKQAVAAIQQPTPPAAKDTITGNPMEGDLSGIGGDMPMTDSVKGKILDGFAAIGFDRTSLEVEYGKPMSEWMESDIPEMREVLKAKKIEQAQQSQQAQQEKQNSQQAEL